MAAVSQRSVYPGWLMKGAFVFLAALAITLLCGSLREKPKLQATAVPDAEIVAEPVAIVPTDASTSTTGPTTQAPPTTTPEPVYHCYLSDHIDRTRIELFPDVQNAVKRPANGSNIFFHETSCRHGVATLSTRQACAVESAAKANPDLHVFLLFASPVGFVRNEPRAKHFDALAAYPNVYLRNVDIFAYTNNTPAESLLRRPDIFQTGYMSVHLSDLLRLVSTYNYGGTHLDLDFVVRKSFAQLAPNFVAEELPTYLNNACIRFEQTGMGHMVVEHLLTEFVRHYDPAVFAANGPALLRRVFSDLCGSEQFLDCSVIKFYPKGEFYAIYGTVWEKMFDKEHGAESMNYLKDSLAVHMWNALSGQGKVHIGDNSAYELLAREHCPKVFATVENGEF